MVTVLCDDAQFVSTYKAPNRNKVAKVKGTNTCELCGGKNYFQFNCLYLCDDDIDGNGIVCQLKIKKSREVICNEIYRTTYVKHCPGCDTRIVMPNMPKTTH